MIILRAKLTEQKPLDVARDAWRVITRGAFQDVGEYWVANYLPGHFEEGAAQKYRYQFRQRSYQDRKDRAYLAHRPMQKGGLPVIAGSDRPNVLTGYMKQQALETNTVRGFPTRATVTIYGPAYLTARYWKKRQPDKAKEITAVRAEEVVILNRILREGVRSRLENYRGQRTSRP